MLAALRTGKAECEGCVQIDLALDGSRDGPQRLFTQQECRAIECQWQRVRRMHAMERSDRCF